MAPNDSIADADADQDAQDAAPPRRRRRPRAPTPPGDDVADDDDDRAPVVVRGSGPPRLLLSTPPAAASSARDDDDDEDAPAVKRARRRPRVEHVSQPPRIATPGDDDDDDARTLEQSSPRSKAKKRQKKRVIDRVAHLPLEIAGIVVFALGVLTLLALLSYSSADSAAGHAGRVHNWIGPGGALLADLLLLAFGAPGFLMPAALFVGGVACFRPIAQPRHALLRVAAGAGAALGTMMLLHLVLRGTGALPFPAGGLVGAIVADALASLIAPLGAGVVAVAAMFVGGVVALDRPLGPTARSIGDRAAELVLSTRERLEIWREERRLLLEEEERLAREIEAAEPSLPPAEVKRRAAEEKTKKKEERKQRIFEEAERRAKERLAEAMEKRKVSLAPVGPSNPPVSADAPRIVSTPSAPGTVVDTAPPAVEPDPPWVLDEPVVDGNVVSLAKVLEKRAAKKAADGALQTDADDDGSFRIVERAHVDPKVVEQAVASVEQPKTAFLLPPLNLLDYDAPAPAPLDEAKMRAQADKLVAKFLDFGIEGRVREVRPGPVCTTYEFVPAPGIKVSKIAALADDIAMAMEAIHVRIVAPIPGKGAVGIEIPNETRETVYMKEIIADAAFSKRPDKLMMALGKDIEGRPYYANLGEMPHVLISGTTGSGKSVSVNAMICSMLYRATPEDVRFLMIDPKMLELSIYDGIPHLLLPPIIDSKKAAVALKWAVNEMERRYQLMSELGVRDIAGFNVRALAAADGKDDEAKKLLTDAFQKACGAVMGGPSPIAKNPLDKLPFIVVVVDEYADLLAVAGKDVEGYVMRLAQKARAAGIHVMLATQRPSVDVITGVIKANFPVRMGFRLASSHDSKTIINRPGAEKLLGRGDMLFMPPGTSNVLRVHGAFISEKELHRVVEFLKGQGKATYDMSILDTPTDDGSGAGGEAIDEPKDARYDEAIAVVARTRKCSTSWLQRMMNLGYQRAARIVDRMEREGLVGPAQNAKGDRDIYLKPDGTPSG
ncbi:MAG: DNA translocase FtsK 4TM domain-containing protein [Deltaproteobacteria bacterium]|nr:DNA translocase FtsK 4TM domain-containing protein [Deltaproteobacteria bacterium]